MKALWDVIECVYAALIGGAAGILAAMILVALLWCVSHAAVGTWKWLDRNFKP